MYTRRTKLMKGIGEWGRGERGGEMTRNEREKARKSGQSRGDYTTSRAGIRPEIKTKTKTKN